MMTQRYPGSVGFSRLLWWAVFVLATVSLSLCFQTFKTFTLMPGLENALALLGALTLLFVAITALIYDGYAKDKAKGKVVKPFGPFEWLFARQYAESDDQGDDGCQE